MSMLHKIWILMLLLFGKFGSLVMAQIVLFLFFIYDVTSAGYSFHHPARAHTNMKEAAFYFMILWCVKLISAFMLYLLKMFNWLLFRSQQNRGINTSSKLPRQSVLVNQIGASNAVNIESWGVQYILVNVMIANESYRHNGESGTKRSQQITKIYWWNSLTFIRSLNILYKLLGTITWLLLAT